MAIDWTEDVAFAAETIAEFGANVTLRKPGGTTGNEWNPTSLPSTDYTVKAVDLDAWADPRGGTLIYETVRTLLIPANGAAVPAVGDSVQVKSKWHVIQALRTIGPGDTVILYEARLGTG